MDTLNAMLTRRSIRAYTQEALPDGTVEQLLRAAMAAPSAANQQPWEFVVIDDRTVLERVPDVHPYAKMASDAPLAVIVCGDMTREKVPGFWVQDCAAAVENLLLAAHAQGLGAVWCGVHPSEERETGIRELAALPDHIIPLALVVVGVPAETKDPADRYDAARIHRNRWGG